MFENASPNGPQNRLKIDEKTHLGTPATTEAPGKLWRYPPAQKHTKITRKHVSDHENLLKNDNVCKRSLGNRNQKIDDSCVLTVCGKNAGRKFTMVASSQRANKTGLRKFMIVASLQQCSWKPPAASKFLQRGGLGEAHLDKNTSFIMSRY